LTVFILGLYFFLCGPEENITSLNAVRSMKITLTSKGNETIHLTPFEKPELIEYYTLNLSEFLINHTINIRLRTENNSRINLYIMNNTQFECWKNGSEPVGEVSKEKLQNAQLLFSPEDTWGWYYLVLLNSEDINVNVHIEIFQTFLVKILNYEYAFAWLKIALLSAIPLFILPLPLRVTLDNIMDWIGYKTLPRKYKNYAEEGVLAGKRLSFHVLLIIVGFVCLLANLYVSSLLNYFTFTGDIWRDYFCRFSILTMLLYVMLLTIFSLTLMLWNFFYLPLTSKFYPNLEVYRKHTKIYYDILVTLLKSPLSIIFYFLFSIFVFSLLMQEIDVSTYLYLLILPFTIYLGYIVSLAYFKTQQKVTTKPEIDFKHVKASFSTGILISVIGINIMWTSFPLLNIISQHILDRSILIAQCSVSGACSSKGILGFFNNIIPIIAYLIPLGGLFLYYSFVFFSVLCLRRKKEFTNVPLPANVLAECMWDLAFFFIVFGLSLWLQSLITPLDFQKILLSLASSFIASSFREYLKTMRTA